MNKIQLLDEYKKYTYLIILMYLIYFLSTLYGLECALEHSSNALISFLCILYNKYAKGNT